jgi:polyhydroxyalkanoate synthesis regulator phasin
MGGRQVIIFAKHIRLWASLDMTNPLINAFFLGRATAEVLSEELQHGLTDVMSNVGKFDAEQRERLRQFTQQVVARAETEASSATPTRERSTEGSPADQNDLQEIIDELRAEIAQLRAALQDYRQKTGA